MTPTLDRKFAHLKLRVVNAEYKYVLFDNREKFLQAMKTISEQITNLPYSIFFTQDECSAIIPSQLPIDSEQDKDVKEWACFHIVGEMPFGTVEGLIAIISNTLCEASIGICAVSSYKTDLFFVKVKNLEKAKKALIQKGWEFV
jgi:hypothetical protein